MITDRGIAVPGDMSVALERVPAALEAFGRLGSARQRAYVDWVGRADGAPQRAARVRALPDHVLADRTAAPPSAGLRH